MITRLQLPAGGVARLTGGPAAGQLGGDLVYFHRSRLIINGVKIQSDSRLDEALVPGDKVSVDMIRNPDEQPYIASEAAWVALAVRVHTVVRGARIAEDMRGRVTGDRRRWRPGWCGWSPRWRHQVPSSPGWRW